MPDFVSVPLKAIIMPSCRKHGKYIDYSISIIDYFWPGHPEIWVISDDVNFKYAKSVAIKSPHWVVMMNQGVGELLKRGVLNEEDYVLLILEDHIPYKEVDAQLILAIANCAIEKKLQFVNLTGHGGEVEKKIAEVNGVGIYEVYPGFPQYSETHPAIWNAGYLNRVMAKDIVLKRLSIWEAEDVIDPGSVHYAAGKYCFNKYIWPTIFSGFLINGRVNIKAIMKMKLPVFSGLRRVLIKDFILRLPLNALSMIISRISLTFKAKLS